LGGDRLACGAKSAFAIGELDFGGLAALLRTRLLRGAVRRFVRRV
jgi:hypothetical protein